MPTDGHFWTSLVGPLFAAGAVTWAFIPVSIGALAGVTERGRGIATSLSQAGARVIGVARDPELLRQLRSELGDSFILVTADAAAPATAGQLIDAYRPAILVLNAGQAITTLITDPGHDKGAYLLTAAGLAPAHDATIEMLANLLP